MQPLLQTQQRWYDFEWIPSPDPQMLFILGVALAAVIAAVFVAAAVSRGRFRREVETRRRHRFAQRARVLRLIPAEAELVRRMARHAEDGDPLTVLKNPALFDGCVENQLASMAARAISADIVDETLALLASIRRKAGLDHVPPGHFLHSTRELPQNQELQVYFKDGDIEEELVSSVLRVSEREIMISVPARDGEPYVLDEGTVIEVEFVRNGDAIYRFKSTVERNFGLRLPLIFISHSSDIERIQLRCFYRIDTDLPVKYRTIAADNLDDPVAAFAGVEDWRDGRITNVSGGGARIELSEKVSFDDFVNFDVSLDNGRTRLNLTAEIVNVVPVDTGTCTAHTAFVGMTEAVREKIVKYVFKSQIHQIRSEQSEIEAARKRRAAAYAQHR